MSVLASLKRVTLLKRKERRLSATKRRRIKRELQSLLKDSTDWPNSKIREAQSSMAKQHE